MAHHSGEHEWAADTEVPEFDAIQFLDGWTGRCFYLGQVALCPHRHPTEIEARTCLDPAHKGKKA